jgi:anti-anti-sigma regulatory factor
MTGTDTGTAHRLVFQGSLSIRTVESIRTTLRETLDAHSVTSVDCSAAEDVDLSFIQLLVSARKSALGAGKQLALHEPPNGALLDALTCGGFVVTHEPDATGGFWFEGAHA